MNEIKLNVFEVLQKVAATKKKEDVFIKRSDQDLSGFDKIENWMKPLSPTILYSYRPL